MATLYLCGAGNPEGVRLAFNINRDQSRWDRIIVLDDNPSKKNQLILDIEIVGPFSVLEQADPASAEVSNLVARTTKGRDSARRKIQAYGLPFASLIAPDVDITWVEFGKDITVYQSASLYADARVGEGSVIFGEAIVGHASRLGRCCVVAPGAVINARVELGDGVYVGTNASILPEVKIGPWATIGANSAVVQDVPAGATVMGVPAQVIIPGGTNQSGELEDGIAAGKRDLEQPFNIAKHQPERTGIRSEALQKLRIAQEKFLADSRSK